MTDFFNNLFTLMSNFLDIDFVIKLNTKRSRRFDLSEAIFKCEYNMKLA